MAFDALIERFAARLQGAGLLVGPIEGAPWIDAFEARLPRRFPTSFGSLVRRYAFLPFEWGPVRFFGNSGTGDDDDLVVAGVRDLVLFDATTKAGLMQFARPSDSNYDPICFDARAPRKNREFPIVRLDHEGILVNERVVIVERVAPSFAALLESLLAGRGNPQAY